jgi:hypothetical protein
MKPEQTLTLEQLQTKLIDLQHAVKDALKNYDSDFLTQKAKNHLDEESESVRLLLNHYLNYK